MVIGAGVNLHLDLGAAGNRAVEKSFAWNRRMPDVFGASVVHNVRPCASTTETLTSFAFDLR